MARSPVLPYQMFDVARDADEARRFDRMESIYHRGQALVWNGKEVLDALWAKHGGSGLHPDRLAPARRILGSVMWGELAAWKIAAQLADDLEPLEARMAATSQSHDEARHFYVLHDYLVRATGDFPRESGKATERLLVATLTANTTAKKILGMQLQLETMALTIFHALRESNVCPVLTELLVYYEKDEARHVGLGLQLLPTLMRRMSIRERVEFTAFSFKVATFAIASLKANEADLRALGVDPRRVAVLGKSKNMVAFNQLWDIAPNQRSDVAERVGHAIDALAEALWPLDPHAPVSQKARRILDTFREGYATVDTTLEPDVRSAPEAPRPSASA